MKRPTDTLPAKSMTDLPSDVKMEEKANEEKLNVDFKRLMEGQGQVDSESVLEREMDEKESSTKVRLVVGRKRNV